MWHNNAMEPTSLLQTLGLLIIYLVILFSTIQGVILGYHWFSYGSSKKTSMTAITTYVGGVILLVLGLIISYT